MPIDWARLRNLTARELTNALMRDGFELRRGRGAHQRYRHRDGRRVTVSFHHPGETFPLGTLRGSEEAGASSNSQGRVRRNDSIASLATRRSSESLLHKPIAQGFSRTVHYEISGAGRIDFQYHSAYVGRRGDAHPVVFILRIALGSH